MSQSRFMVLDARDEHQTDQEIADFLGVSVGWVNEVKTEMQGGKKFTSEKFASGSSKREQAEEYIKHHPEASNREIASETPVSRTTAGKVKKELEEELDKVSRLADAARSAVENTEEQSSQSDSKAPDTDTQTDEGSMD